MENQLSKYQLDSQKGRKPNTRSSQQCRGANGHDRERKNSVGSEFQEAQESVLARPRMALGPPHRYSGLAETHPAPHSSQVAVMLRHSSKLLDHASRHESEVPGVQW